MSFLEGLHRERYLVLRGLRLAQQRTARPDSPRDQLVQLLDFLDAFALRHFLERELRLLESWEHRDPRRVRLAELETLRHAQRLGRGLVECIQRSLAEGREPARVLADLGRLIAHLSRTLARGERAVSTLEQALAATEEPVRVELAAVLPDDGEVERRYVTVIRVLEGGDDEDDADA